jgi:hypothetical protein
MNFRSPCHETCPTITLNRYPRLGHHRATRSRLTFCPLRSKAPSRSPGHQGRQRGGCGPSGRRAPGSRCGSRRGQGALADPRPSSALNRSTTAPERPQGSTPGHPWRISSREK